MNREEFDKIIEERINKIREVLLSKGKEYQRNDNVFHNFERGSNITGNSREKVMWGFALKHLISFMDILDDCEKYKYPSIELLEEKVGDIINYLILEEASIKEQIKINMYGNKE